MPGGRRRIPLSLRCDGHVQVGAVRGFRMACESAAIFSSNSHLDPPYGDVSASFRHDAPGTHDIHQ